MNINKMAKQDAHRVARADMFFGEGAGTRRKLLNAEISDKLVSIPGYAEKFNREYEKQDMADHAIEAAKERKRLDRKAKMERNVRGFTTGNRSSFTTSVGLAAALWVFAHQTGLDEPIKHEVWVRYKKTQAWVKVKKAEWKLRYHHN